MEQKDKTYEFKQVEVRLKVKEGDPLYSTDPVNCPEAAVKLLADYIKDMDEAKDITNIVFLKVYNKLNTFTEYESFGGWLRIIANRTAIDYLRKVKDKEIFGVETERLTEAAKNISSNESEIVDRMTYEQLLKQFNKLPEVHKRVCLLFYKDNLTIPQIADATRLPTGTIKSILSRTRKKLKNNKQIN